MLFQKYIERNVANKYIRDLNLPKGVSLIVVIPCYNENDLDTTLFSLSECIDPGVRCAVIVVMNSRETDSPDMVDHNEKTFTKLQRDKAIFDNKFCTFHGLHVHQLPQKHAGVGLARKIGMDSAVWYWHEHSTFEGIIVSLDADAIVGKNYLISIIRSFKNNPKQVAATINFEHNLEIIDQLHKRGIILYELYMRYYKNAMAYTGFCPSIYTIGSCFAVRAKAYVAQGGMNRKKAGEDFYFLHKLAPLGKIGVINSTTIKLSSRMSDRVPFGTGPQIKKWINEEVDLQLTYPFRLFERLYSYFSKVENIYQKDHDLSGIDQLFELFLTESAMNEKISELKRNCGSISIFKRRFFHLFNAFIILKWLNFAQDNGIAKQNLIEAVNEMLDAINRSDLRSNEELELLMNLRDLDRRV